MNKYVIELYQCSVTLKDRMHPVLEAQEKKFAPDDIRISIVAKPLGSIILQILLFNSNLATFYNHDWWDKLPVPECGRKAFSERVDNFYKYGIFIQFISVVESELRVLIRELEPDACKGGKAPFICIYETILRRFGLNEYKNLFAFSRLIRNAIHNNGVHFPDNCKDEKIEFKGVEYEFRYGKEIDFFYPSVLADIQDEMFVFLKKIINHNKMDSLETIPTTIK